MLSSYLQRGVAAGAIAGAFYGAYVYLVLNPQVEYMEDAAHGDGGHGHDHAGGHAHDAVAEATTAAVSAGGGVLWGVLLGTCFAAAYYLLEPALPGGDLRSYVLAAAGLVTVSLAPWSLLPPAAPGVEHLLSTDTRLLLYAGMMLVGAATSAASVYIYSRTRGEAGRLRALAAGAAPLAVLPLVAVAAPELYAGGADPYLAGSFAWMVAFGQAALWMGIASTFDRLEGRMPSASPVDYGVEPSTARERSP